MIWLLIKIFEVMIWLLIKIFFELVAFVLLIWFTFKYLLHAWMDAIADYAEWTKKRKDKDENDSES